MDKFVMATANPNKIIEIQNKIGNKHQFLSLKEIGCFEEIPETSDTIEGNALQKARYVFENYGYYCFSEDTGLEVDALDGAPGVITAHYSGQRDANANMDKLLREMQGITNRKARFKTVIALKMNSNEYLMEGIVYGTISDAKRGDDGFGYDPVFIPDGYDSTYAEMSLEEKNKMSHRALAVAKLKTFLDKYRRGAI